MSPTKDDLRVAVMAKVHWMVSGPGPEIRSEVDMRAILGWLETAIDALPLDDPGEWNLDASLLAGLMRGDMEVAGVTAGEVRFRLTAQGHQTAAAALMNDPEMRHFYQSLIKGAAVDGPKQPQ